MPALTCSALKHDTLCNAKLLVAITPIAIENRRNFNSLSSFLSASPANEENILNNRKKEHLQNEQNILHNRKKQQRSLRSQTATKQREAKKARERSTNTHTHKKLANANATGKDKRATAQEGRLRVRTLLLGTYYCVNVAIPKQFVEI